MRIILPLTFEDVFQRSSDRRTLEFISEYSKVGLLKRLTFLGEKTEKCIRKLIQNPIKANSEYLELFAISENIRQKINSVLTNQDGALHTVFSRDTLLWAIEFILNSNIESNEIDFEVDDTFTYKIFLFLLSINSDYLKSNLTENSSFEDINASLIPANSFPENEIFLTPRKGAKLFEFLLQNPKYCELLNEYIESKYKVKVNEYCRCILRWGLGTGYIIKMENTNQEYSIIKGISDSRISNDKIERLISIKRSPIFQCAEDEFIALDRSFLLGKLYNQFIFDFWFDWIKVKTKIPVDTYFGDIGHFFENYTVKILNSLFSFSKHPVPLSLEELEYNSGSGTKEICDFYSRENKKVILCEIKLGNINDESRFSGKTEKLYKKKDQDDFFKPADQLNQAIINLKIIQEKFDNKIPLQKSIEIFPICIFNDSIYNLGTMSVIFDRYWKSIVHHDTKLKINPLTIIHIDQLELLDSFLETKDKKKQIFDLLKRHCKKAGIARSFEVSLIKGYKLKYDDQTIKQLQSIINE